MFLMELSSRFGLESSPLWTVRGGNKTWTVNRDLAYDLGVRMDKWEQSRREWEQEISERQHNVTPAEQLRTAHYIAKRSSGALIPDFAHFIRFVLGGASLA